MTKDFRPALRHFLLADPALNAMVGGERIEPEVLSQGETRPSLVVSTVSEDPDFHSEGPSGLNRLRLQITAWAKQPDDAAALANLVKDRLFTYRGVMGEGDAAVQVQGVFIDTAASQHDATAELHGVRRDFFFWIEE